MCVDDGNVVVLLLSDKKVFLPFIDIKEKRLLNFIDMIKKVRFKIKWFGSDSKIRIILITSLIGR